MFRRLAKAALVKVVPAHLLAKPCPVTVRHWERSLLLSADDDEGKPTPALIALALELVKAAGTVDLGDVTKRITEGVPYTEVWPGEHYKLLAAMVRVLQPRRVIEIGTASGLSALSLMKYLPPDGKLLTYDLLGWKGYPGQVLRDADFADGRLTQHADDLSDPAQFARLRESVEAAELIFVDAAKDGAQEQRFLDHFETCRFKKPPLVVFDDIRLWNMLAIWRSVKRPKLDLTSFGHWSGTGLILWS